MYIDKCPYNGICNRSASKFFIFWNGYQDTDTVIGVCESHYNCYLYGDTTKYKEISHEDAIVFEIMET